MYMKHVTRGRVQPHFQTSESSPEIALLIGLGQTLFPNNAGMKNRTDLNLSEVAYTNHLSYPRSLTYSSEYFKPFFFLLCLSVNQQLIRISCFQLNDQ